MTDQPDDLQAILDSLPMLFFQKDAHNTILRTNKAAADAMGCAVADLEGALTADWFPDEAEAYHADDLRVIRSGLPETGIVEQFQPNDSEKHWTQTDKYPRRGENGEVDGVFVFVHDATAQTRAQIDLRASEERLRTILDSEPQCVKVLNPDGTIAEINPAGLRMVEADSLEEVLGALVYDVIDPEHHADFAELHRSVMAGEAGTLEYEIIGRKGTRRWIETYAVPMTGIEQSFLAMSLDVTERREADQKQRELEAQLRHAQRLESIGLLAGGVAHDFNNQLMSIIGNTELALTYVDEESPASRKLHTALRSAQQAAELCDQLLTYAGRRPAQLRPTDITEVVGANHDLLRLPIPSNAELAFDLDVGVEDALLDPTQVSQVLVNLVANAADALGNDGGRVEISTGTRMVTAAELAQSVAPVDNSPGVYVCVRVSDSGCGMSPHTMEMIFEPFFTTKSSGRGLGLATTLGTIVSMAGALLVTSTPGLGSVFEVLFPVSGETPSIDLEEPRANHEHHDGGLTILLADDDPAVQEVLRQHLESAGFGVLTADDGNQAVDRFRSAPDDVSALVLDLAMPGLDGVQVYREIAAMAPDVPVLFSSGHPEGAMMQTFADKPHVDFINKPYSGVELRAKLDGVLANTPLRTE
ncbi:MAG: hybrid sensor histidine kinase/response regulator [Acidimicrobiales bacterium]